MPVLVKLMASPLSVQPVVSNEIGRASCRARVEMQAVAVLVPATGEQRGPRPAWMRDAVRETCDMGGRALVQARLKVTVCAADAPWVSRVVTVKLLVEAEAAIRVADVASVLTCALPIWPVAVLRDAEP